MSEDSSTEEEINETLREAANCDYVNKLYRNEFNTKSTFDSKKNYDKSKDRKESSINSHQQYIADKLMERLDKNIIFVDNHLNYQRNPKVQKGIQLCKDSVYIDNFEDVVIDIKKQLPPKPKLLSDEEYLLRAGEAAVSTDWVASKTNTIHWRSHKKPKIVNLKKIRNLSNEKIECDIISTTNIPEKDRLF